MTQRPPGGEAIPTLAVRQLRVARKGNAILRGVDLVANAGEIVGVLGPSGAGKSTLLRALVGEAPPQAGSIMLAGNDVTKWPLWKRARAGVGYLAQGSSVLWELTLAQNLTVFARVAGVPDEALLTLSERLGLGDRLHVVVNELSAGERRRLDLVRATARHPRLLVCDEPFAGLDPAASERV